MRQAVSDANADASETPAKIPIPAEIMACAVDGAGHLAAEPTEVFAAAINNAATAEEGFEAAHFKVAALVAHVHLLLKKHAAAAVDANGQIAHLRPGKHHRRKVNALSHQAAAEFACGQSVNGLGAAQALWRCATQENDPVNECCQCQRKHGKIFVTERPLLADGLGKERPRDRQRHRQGFVVFQLLRDSTGNGVVCHGIVHQRIGGFGIIGACKNGNAVKFARKGDGELHLFNGACKT